MTRLTSGANIALTFSMLNNKACLALLCVLSACVGVPDASGGGVSFLASARDPEASLSDIREWRLESDGSESLVMVGLDETGVTQLTMRLTRRGEDLAVTLNDGGGIVISPELEILEDTLPEESDTEIEDDLLAMVLDVDAAIESPQSGGEGIDSSQHFLVTNECPRSPLLPNSCGQLRKVKWFLYAGAVALAVGGGAILTGGITVASLIGFGVAEYSAYLLTKATDVIDAFKFCAAQPANAPDATCE